jgi:hypothetical protein
MRAACPFFRSLKHPLRWLAFQRITVIPLITQRLHSHVAVHAGPTEPWIFIPRNSLRPRKVIVRTSPVRSRPPCALELNAIDGLRQQLSQPVLTRVKWLGADWDSQLSYG